METTVTARGQVFTFARFAANAAYGYSATSTARTVRALAEAHQTDEFFIEALKGMVSESLNLGWGHETPFGVSLSTKMQVLERALDIALAPHELWGLCTYNGRVYCPPDFFQSQDALVEAPLHEGDTVEGMVVFSLSSRGERAIFRDNVFKGCIGHVENTTFVDCHFYNTFFNGENIRYINCTFHASLGGLFLDNSTLTGCTFSGELNRATFYAVDFSGCSIPEIRESRLVSCTFNRSNIPVLEESTVLRCDLADTVGQRWVGNSFEDCTFTSVRVEIADNAIHGQISLNHSKLGSMKANKKCKLCHEPHYALLKGICPNCRAVGAYSCPNTATKGKSGRLPSFSVEFEVQECGGSDEYNPVELLLYGFTAHQDSSVDVEYKSPIYLSMAPFIPALRIMDTCREWVGTDCGTHIHVGFNEWKREYFHEHFFDIVSPMVAWMKEHKEETREFWGRYFHHGFASSNAPIESRYMWLNTTETDKPTIEWRLPKFRNADQFKAVVVFCRKASAFLEDAVHDEMDKEECEQVGARLLSLYTHAVAAFFQKAAVASA